MVLGLQTPQIATPGRTLGNVSNNFLQNPGAVSLARRICRRIPLGIRYIQINRRSALFGRNNFFNVFDVFLNFVNLRMHVAD
jgi:hypothetical protein